MLCCCVNFNVQAATARIICRRRMIDVGKVRCLATLNELTSNSIDRCVTDPPYDLRSIHKALRQGLSDIIAKPDPRVATKAGSIRRDTR
jgi:hypothetical protein